ADEREERVEQDDDHERGGHEPGHESLPPRRRERIDPLRGSRWHGTEPYQRGGHGPASPTSRLPGVVSVLTRRTTGGCPFSDGKGRRLEPGVHERDDGGA